MFHNILNQHLSLTPSPSPKSVQALISPYSTRHLAKLIWGSMLLSPVKVTRMNRRSHTLSWMGIDYTITLSIRNTEETSGCFLILFNQFSQQQMLNSYWQQLKHREHVSQSEAQSQHIAKILYKSLQYHSPPIFNGSQANCLLILTSLMQSYIL